MIYKTKKEAAELGIQPIDLEQVLNELICWQKEYSQDNDPWADPVRVAMIDSFEDILLNAIIMEA